MQKKDLKLTIVDIKKHNIKGFNLNMNTKTKEETNWANTPINRQSFYIVLNACLINLNKARMAHAVDKKLLAHDKKELYSSLSKLKFKTGFNMPDISTSYLNQIIQKKDPWAYIEAFENKFKWSALAIVGASFIAALIFIFISTMPGKQIISISFFAIVLSAVFTIRSAPQILVKMARRNMFLNNLYILKFLKKARNQLEKTTNEKDNLKYKLDTLLGARQDFRMTQAYETYWALANDLERVSEKSETTMTKLFKIKEQVQDADASMSEKDSLQLYEGLVELLNNDNPATIISYQDGPPILWQELTNIMDTILYHKRDDLYHITQTAKMIGKLEADYIKFVEITILLLIKERKYFLLYAMVLEMYKVSSFKMSESWDHLCDKYHIDIEGLLSCVNKKNPSYIYNLKRTIDEIKAIDDDEVRDRHLSHINSSIPAQVYQRIGQERPKS